MKIYTKTGDKGTTSLFGGTRVPKSHIRLEAYGTIDELNSHLGFLYALLEKKEHEKIKEIILKIQNDLFCIGSVLATEDKKKLKTIIKEEQVEFLEKEIDLLQEDLSSLRGFVLPQGSLVATFSHVCRTVCRRAERYIYKLSTEVEIQENVIIYINRLSDFLFVLARKINKIENIEEILFNNNCE